MSREDWKRPKVVMPIDKRRIKLVISYDGSAFHGWQEQRDEVTVQEVIRCELEDFLEEEIELPGSGRTDSGVHALGQVAHFDTKSTLPAEKFAIILNSRLPLSIRIIQSEEVKQLFHARYTSYAREYWYYIKEWKDMLPFDSNRYAALKKLPSLDLLNEYAAVIVGTHDFTSFCSSKDICPSKVRDIYISKWDLQNDSYGLPFYRYIVVGNAFLYHQVRSMVGTMVEAALKEESVNSFKERLDKKNREMALKTYPSEGLYLKRVSYDEEEYRWFEEKYGR